MWWEAIPGVATIVTKILGLIPDPNQKAQLEFELEKLQGTAEIQIALAQVEANKIEAGSTHWIAANWRGLAGMVCVLALFQKFVLSLYFNWISAMFHGPVMPAVDTAELMPLLLGMLGLGYLRSDEKKSGIAAGMTPAARAAAITTKLRSSTPIVVTRTGGVP